MTIREHRGPFEWHASDLPQEPGMMLWPVMGMIFAAMGVSFFVLYLGSSVPLATVGIVIAVALFVALALELMFVPRRGRLIAVAATFAAIPIWTCVWMIVIGLSAGLFQGSYS